MSKRYMTQSGRVSRPPRAYGAGGQEEPDGDHQHSLRRTSATFTMPESSGSELGDFEVEHRAPSPMQMIQEEPAERTSPERWDVDSNITAAGQSQENREYAEDALSDGGRSRTGTGQPEGAEHPVETSYDAAPLIGHVNEFEMRLSEPREEEYSAEVPKGSQRSPEWLREMGLQLDKNRAEVAAIQERERARSAAKNSSLNYYTPSASGMPKYRSNNNREDEPPQPRVLVPGTPESDATQPSQRSGKVTDPLARQPNPLKPQARGPRHIKNRGQGLWEVLKKSVKPVQEWLADVSAAGQTTNLVLSKDQEDPAKREEDAVLETEFEVDEETIDFMRKYSTPEKKQEYLETKDESDDVAMTDRIPAKDKGKARDPAWGAPLAETTGTTAPSAAPIDEPRRDVRTEQGTDENINPQFPISILKIRPEEAVRRGKARERELEQQIAKEREEYARIVAETEELQLRIAIRESELESRQAESKKMELEETLRRSRAESHKRREGEPSRRRKTVEIARDAIPPKDLTPMKERPKSGMMRAREAEEAAPKTDPKTTELAKRIAEKAKELTDKLRKAEDRRAERPRPIEPTPSTMTMGSGRSRGPMNSQQTTGSGRSRGRKEDETLSEQEGHSRSASSTRSDSTTPKDTSSDSDEEKHEKKRKKKKKKSTQRRAAIKAIHLNKPRNYNGEAIYDKYEAWMEDFGDWRELHELDEYGTMIAMSLVLTGDAKEWYNLNVRSHEKEWTMDGVSEQMFNDLFPENFASILRQTFEDARQRDNSLKKWHKYLVKLSKRVQFVDEHELRLRFWHGSASYLQKEWVKIGLKPEDPMTKVETMLESGLRFERAKEYEKAEEKRSSFNTRGLRESISKPRPNDYLYKEKQPWVARKAEGQSKKNAQPGPSKEQKRDNRPSDGGRNIEKKKLTEEEKAQLRADDCCFQCGKHGHIARNCPSRREAPPPKRKGDKNPPLYNGSMQFEERTRNKRDPVIRLGMMEIEEDSEDSDTSTQGEENLEEAWGEVARERATLQRAIILTYLYEELAQVETRYEWQRNSPMRRYRFEFGYTRRGVIRIWDRWQNWYAFLREELLYEDGFSLRAWVNERDLTEPRILNDPPPLPEDGHEISESEPEESTDMEVEEQSTDSDDDDMPELMSVSDVDEEGEEGHSVAPSDSDHPSATPSESEELSADPEDDLEEDDESSHCIPCNPMQTANRRAKPKARKQKSGEKFWENIEDNSNVTRNDKRTIPHPIILTVYINGRACRALLDSGAYSDFMSTTLVDNLGLKKKVLPTPLTLQMAVQGSRSKINAATTVEFQYSTIKCEKTFDIVNIASYDLILGTTFIWQHKIVLGMNPTRVAIGSNDPLKIEGTDAHTIMGALAMQREDDLEDVRDMLRREAQELCEDAAKSALPPFRAINHKIPLIDEAKTYRFRPSKCPRALEPLWREKSGEYLRSGRWKMATGSNPIPILLIQKPRKDPNDPIKIRACFDKREQNANTRKMASPMPDQTEVLERVAARKYRTVIDGRDAYEQIRVESEDVWKTLFNTPDGLMESLVLQQGDCNGPATYQSLMNYIFAGHIGVWMDVYLDDIVIYSDTLKDHIAQVRKVFDILKREKLFLNPKKMQFIAPELELLGHRVTDDGIKMDPHKVDSIKKWPVPTSKELLASFIGAVGYLADGIRGVRIPMAVLNKITGSTKLWRWGPTEQRSFDQVKDLVHAYRESTRVPLSYAKEAPMIWLVTDASMTGAAGHVCQGEDWKTATPVAFWSGKFSSAEQAYPTHEQELLAIVESLKRFRHHLLGTKFTIVTDHEKLDKFMTQRDLSRRQTRWLETLCDFDFEIKYSPGKLNVLADALSRIYSSDNAGTERASSEYVSNVNPEEEAADLGLFNMAPTVWPSRPILVGREVEVELLTINVTHPKPRRNPDRKKAKGISLREESSSEDSLDTAIAPERQRGRPRKSVPQPTAESRNMHADDESSEAPGSSGESEMLSPIRPRAATAIRRAQVDPDDEGESEMEDLLPKRIAIAAKDPQELARDELREAEKELEQGQLPDPKGQREALGVKLTDIISDIEIPGDLEGRYAEDAFFAKVIEDPTHYTNFKVVGEKGKELVYLKESGEEVLCIPDIMVGTRKAREVVITHAHSILAHLGSRKTLWYLRDNVWWKDMVKDITDYCTSCEVCARTKSTNQKPMGLLHPLKVPKRPWEQIGVDFVGPLPEARNRHGAFDQVMVVIDHLTSMVHIVPVKMTYRARQVAEVFYETVYKLHGLPERIVSDRDKIFTSTFWQNLHRLINVEIKMSSTYHPQTDGATERANRTMVQMIRQAIGEKDTRWIEKLPSIEWAMNAARSETTGFSPFFLNYGHRPRPLIWNNAEKDSYPGVHAFAQKLKDAIMTAHDAILEKRVKQTRQANKSRRPSAIETGDLVYLSTKNLKLPKGKSRKLVPKFVGPYRVTKELSKGATYQLELPRELISRGVNNAFHASLLRIYVPNCDTRFPGRQIPQLSAFGVADEGLEVDRIRTHSGRGEEALFELIWKNGESTWEPMNRVKGLEALVEYLEAMGVRRIENLPPGAGKPPADDPEIFLGAMSAIEFEAECYKKAARGDGNSLAQSPPPKATPALSKSTRFHFTMNPSKYNKCTYQRVGKKRQDTPHPYYIPPSHAPVGPKAIDNFPDSFEIAVAVAKASTTTEIAAIITKIVDKMPPARLRMVRHQVETDPSSFYSIIGMLNIVERTAKSATRKTPKAKTDQPGQTLTANVMTPLVPVFNELLNHSKISNTFLQELVTHHRNNIPSTSTTKDPRTVAQPQNQTEMDIFLAKMGIHPQDDAEMIDISGEDKITDNQVTQENWLEEDPEVIDSIAATAN